MDGVHVVDVGRPRNRALRFICTGFLMLRAARKHSWKWVHFHDPELLVIGVLLCRSGAIAIYDAHEDLPRAILSKAWIPHCLRMPLCKLAEVVENGLVRRVSAVVAATPAIHERFSRIARRSVLVANYPVEEELDHSGDQPRNPTVCYVGGVEEIRGALTMVRAVELAGVELELAGSIYPTHFQSRLIAEPGWPRVRYHGLVPRVSARAIMRRCSIGLLLFLPEPNHVESQPNKLFEYMAAGLPVIASDFPLWRQIIERVGCGVLVDPTNPRAVASAITQMLANPEAAAEMGKRGREAVAESFTWKTQRQCLISLYEALGAE